MSSIPNESGEFNSGEQHAINRSGQGASAQLRVVCKVEDVLESGNQGLEFCGKAADFFSDSKSCLGYKSGQERVSSVLAVVPEPAQEVMKVVVGKLIAEVSDS